MDEADLDESQYKALRDAFQTVNEVAVLESSASSVEVEETVVAKGKGKKRAVAADKEKGKKPAVAAKSEKEKKESSTGAKASRSTGKRKEEKVDEEQDEEEVSVI